MNDKFTEFRELLRNAIGPNRTQSEFAKDAGLTPQYLNRLLNSDNIGCPTKTTLMKISGASFGGIPLAKFMKACGYSDADEEMKSELRAMDLKGRVKRCVDTLIRVFTDLAKSRPICNNLYEFADMALILNDEEDVSFSVNSIQNVDFGEFNVSEKVAIISLSWGDDYDISKSISGFTVELDLLVCFSETTGGHIMVFDVKTDQKTLKKFGSKVVWNLDTMDEYRDDGYACTIKYKSNQTYIKLSNMTAEERLLHAIFGDDDQNDTRVVQVEGLGFYLDNTPVYVIKKFIENHIESLDVNTRKLYESSKDDFNEDNKTDEDNYPNYLIAQIIREETGIHVLYDWNRDIDGSRPAVIFPARHPWKYSEQERSLTEDGVCKILENYARELRTEVDYCICCWEFSDEFEL